MITQQSLIASSNILAIGPRIKSLTHHPVNFQDVDISNQDELNTSTSNSDVDPEVSDFVNSNRSFLTGLIESVTGKQKKKAAQNPAQLKQIVKQQKIKIIVKGFINKLSRNNINATPVDYTPFVNEKEFLDTQGIELNDYFQIGCFLCSIFLTISLSILSSLCTVFNEIEVSIIFKGISWICLIYFTFEVLLSLITVKFQEGKRLGTLRQILEYYLRKTFLYDILIIIILLIDQFVDQHEITITYMRLFIIFKLPQVFQRVQRLQVFFIRNFYYEQYWSLIKVFLFNFSLAHILAIFLIGMAFINMDESWMERKEIVNAPWYEKYFWAYYWATTIMLTVGFGDLTATNYEEAIFLTFIEMISCIALGYNINCVGLLISNIRAQDLQKGKNFKVFYKLSRKNDLPEDLEWRINNYIEESSNIKKKFNYEEENQFVDKLPQGLKTQFLKESNNKIFKNLPFFKNLMERTVFSFAQKIEMHICHPEETIQHLDDPHNLLILKGGEIGFTCKKSGCQYNSTVIDQLKIINEAHPILISLGFIYNPRLTYEIKSVAYSVLYFLDYESILSILKGSQMDYELYCLLKDKAHNTPDAFQLFNCEICKGKHTKFNCPKLHFIPIRQHITDRYIYRVKFDKNLRIFEERQFTNRKRALKIYKNSFKKMNTKSSRSFSSRRELGRSPNYYNALGVSKRYEEVQEIENPNNLVKEISEIKDFFSRSTVELIKNEVTKALSVGEAHDEVWIVESDKMKNYKNYFEMDNSCNLIDKFSVVKRTRKNTTIIVPDKMKKSSKNLMKESRRNALKDERDQSLSSGILKGARPYCSGPLK